MKVEPVFIVTNKRMKQIGYIDGERYVTDRDTKKHWFRKYSGWAISKGVLDALKSRLINTIIIRVKNSKTLYLTTREQYEIWGTIIPAKMSKEDTQVVLSLEHFEVM